MPRPSVANEVDEFKNTKNDLDTAKTDPSLLQNMDQTEQELDNLESVVGALGNDTMQNLLMENPDMDKDLDVMSEAVIQIRNGMPPQQAAVTLQKLQLQKASAKSREQDLAMQSGDMTKEPQGTVEDIMQPQQQEEPGMTDMEHLQLIGKSQKAKSSKRFKPVKKEYKTIGFWGWCARVVSHAVFSVLTAAQTVINQGVRLGKAAGRKFIRWKNGTAKREAEERRAREEENAQTERMFGPEDDMEPEKTPLEKIQSGADDQAILDDYRKLPLVWENTIAENPKQKPYISVDVNIKNEDKENDLLAGGCHTCMALNYTRFKRNSGRNERCRVKFGFYMGGGLGPTSSMEMAMTGAGSYVPGRLDDDSKTKVTVGKRYEATNKQINHILNAAENYPQGGYNVLKRNCTTFVAELTQQAGIDTSDILKEEDLNLGAAWLAAPIIPLVEPFFRFRANQRLNHVAGKKDESYGREGKQLLTEEDKQRFKEASDNTIRFSGQSPAATAGRIRSGSATILHSDSYDVDDKIKDFMSKVSAEEQNLLKKIRPVLGDDFKEDIDLFVQQMHSQEQEIEELKNRLGDMKFDVESTAEDRNQVRMQLVDRLQGLRKYISEWYYGVAEGDNRLILPFLHMASILEREEKVHNNSYESLADESRDVSEQLKLLHKNKNFYAGVKSEQGGPASKIPASTAMLAPAECAAYVKVFGSVKNGIEMYLRKRKLDQANKNKPEKEKKHDRSLERKFENVRMYMKALEYNEVRKGITQEDTDFAFQTLVEGQKDVQTKDDTNIAGLYQALAYEKVFGGMKIWLSNAAAQHTDMQMLLNEDVTDYLSDKVKGNGKDAFRMILSSVKKSLGDQANDEEIYQRFIETFEKTYLDRVLRSILDPKQEDASAQKNITGYFNMMKDGSSGNMEAFKEYVLSIIAKL